MQAEVFFDNSLPYGNGLLCGVEEKGGVLEVSVTPEAKNAPESLWFCFRLKFRGCGKARKLRLIVKYLYNSLGGIPAETVNPVARPSSGGRWRRLPDGKTVALPDGRCDAVWEIGIVSESMDFAFCIPYGVPELDALVEKSKGYFKKDVIGISPEGRSIVRIANNYGDPTLKKPGLYLLARQHSGETSGSWALHGFLARLSELKAQELTVWCLPLSNIDGIEKGYYGKDNFPMDLNRAWGNPPMRYENTVFQRDIALWAQRTAGLLALDFHSPGGCEAEGVYCFIPKNSKGGADRLSAGWAKRFEGAIPSGYASSCLGRVANYASRWDSPNFNYTKFMRKFHNVPALSFEFPYSQIRGKVLEIDDYMAIGGAMAEAVLAFLRGKG